MIALSTLQESRRYDDPANPAGHAQLHHAQGHDLMRSLGPDEERRESKRCKLYHSVKLQFGADLRPRECVILDISDEGVRVYVVGFDIPDEFVLLFSDAVQERCKVIWRRDREVGAKLIGRALSQNECDVVAVA
jgi:hypothetical protein